MYLLILLIAFAGCDSTVSMKSKMSPSKRYIQQKCGINDSDPLQTVAMDKIAKCLGK